MMKRHPRKRLESITDRRFLLTMVFTGVLTAGVAFAVFDHYLQTADLEAARTAAFSVLVFAELLRAFGARSASKPIWRVSLLTNLPLLLVVVLSFALQFWSQHSALLGGFLKISPLPTSDFVVLLVVGAIPLAVLELVKVVRPARHS
jgi:Ca2+-transporting ATPase